MHIFTDNNGRTWPIVITVATAKRCRALLGVDLYGLVADRLAGLSELLANPIQLVDVVYVLCKDETDRQKVTDEDFGQALGGDSLQRASDAFVAELIDFFPDPRVRAGMTKIVETARIVQERLLETVEEQTRAIDIDAIMKKLNGSSGGSPGSLESTPDPSPSASST